MKKSFQIWRDVTIAAGAEKVISEQLKENYAKATGFFVVPFDNNNLDLSKVTLFLKIAQTEILPKGTDASIVAFNGNVAREQTIYDFSKDNIPAKSSDFDLTITNDRSSAVHLNIYVVLENE